MHVHRLERIWIGLCVGTLVVFLGLLGAAAISQGLIPPSHLQSIDPTKVSSTPPFDNPGLRKLPDGSYEAYIVARIFSFTPSAMKVPRGARVTFYSTSPDVVHGFFIANTDVNMLVVPGWVSTASHVFNKPGSYLLMCNEYCGAGHHYMYGTIEVR